MSREFASLAAAAALTIDVGRIGPMGYPIGIDYQTPAPGERKRSADPVKKAKRKRQRKARWITRHKRR